MLEQAPCKHANRLQNSNAFIAIMMTLFRLWDIKWTLGCLTMFSKTTLQETVIIVSWIPKRYNNLEAWVGKHPKLFDLEIAKQSKLKYNSILAIMLQFQVLLFRGRKHQGGHHPSRERGAFLHWRPNKSQMVMCRDLWSWYFMLVRTATYSTNILRWKPFCSVSLCCYRTVRRPQGFTTG